MSDSWPVTTARDTNGELLIGGVSVPALAREFGTPLYVFDEVTLRTRAQDIRTAFDRAKLARMIEDRVAALGSMA